MNIKIENMEFTVYNGTCPPLGYITSSCYRFTYCFNSGVYILSGEIDEGGFALSYLLGGAYTKKQLLSEETIIVNNEPIALSKIKNIACYLGERENKQKQYCSIKKQIKNALKRSKLSYDAEDIRTMFRIDSDRFNRPLNKVGVLIWQSIAAISFAEGKKIFTFPWFSSEMLNFHFQVFEVVLPILKANDCIVIIPATNFKKLDGLYDHVVNPRQMFMEEVYRKETQSKE